MKISFININIKNINESLTVIENILKDANQIYSKRKDYLDIARKKLLLEYNIFPLIVKFYKERVNNSDNSIITKKIKPSKDFWDHFRKMNTLRLKRYLTNKIKY